MSRDVRSRTFSIEKIGETSHNNFCGHSYSFRLCMRVHKQMNFIDLERLLQKVFQKIIDLAHDENASVVRIFFYQFP